VCDGISTRVLVPPFSAFRRLLFVLASDVTSCIVAALCSVRQSVSRVAAVSQSAVGGWEG